jgi:hypothetical protein
MDGSAVRHFIARHGAGREKRPDHVPVTDADFEQIPDIISRPDRIEYAGNTDLGLPAIR